MPTDGYSDKKLLGDAIVNRNKAVNATIFTYSVGSGSSQEILKHIACSNNGIWQYIPGKNKQYF